ncbi:hypothetical protein I3843_04G117300 [Carya illinoinensis]|nr:hypothetical protein I3843_04G117300 [Carya illinoinensis]
MVYSYHFQDWNSKSTSHRHRNPPVAKTITIDHLLPHLKPLKFPPHLKTEITNPNPSAHLETEITNPSRTHRRPNPSCILDFTLYRIAIGDLFNLVCSAEWLLVVLKTIHTCLELQKGIFSLIFYMLKAAAQCCSYDEDAQHRSMDVLIRSDLIQV